MDGDLSHTWLAGALEIRDAGEGDLAFLREMLEMAVYVGPDENAEQKLARVRPILDTFFDGFGRHGDLALIALIGDQIAGAIWTRLRTAKTGDAGFVDERTPELIMAVLSQYRGNGIGTRLMTELFARLAAGGFDRVSLAVDKRNPALRLYRRMHFDEFCEHNTGFTMVRPLP